MIRQRYKNSITQCKTYPGADIGSDHNPVIARITVKLKRPDQKSNDISLGKLPDSAFTDNFRVEVKNRFEVLANEDEPQNLTVEETITKDYARLKDSIISAAKDI